jgi:hypothetical protein
MPTWRQTSPTGTPPATWCNTVVICSTEKRFFVRRPRSSSGAASTPAQTVSDVKRLRELEAENARLKRMYADLGSRMRRSRTCLAESCDAVREATGRGAAGGRASPFGAARLSRGEAHAGGVLSASSPGQPSRCRGHHRADRCRRPLSRLGLLEVCRSVTPRWSRLESQAGASGVLRAAAESAAADAPPAAPSPATTTGRGAGAESYLGTGHHGRHAL